MFRLDRSRTAGPLLEWKVALFVVAAGLGLGGMYLDERWLTGAAIVLLLGGVLLRLSPKAAPDRDGDDVRDDGGPAQDGDDVQDNGEPTREDASGR